MNKILYIILSLLLFSLTMISCNSDDAETISKPIEKTGDTVNDGLDSVGDGFNDAGNVVSDVVDPVGDGLNDAGNVVSDVLDPVGDGLNDAVDVVNDGVEEITSVGGGSGTVSPKCDVNTERFCPEHGASVWEFEKNKKDSGYALVGRKDKRPWIQIVDENGKYQMSKGYNVFGEYKSNFGNGLPSVGQLDGSAISQTKDGGYIVGTYVNPRHPSYGLTHIFKTNKQGEIEWKKELKYKSGKTNVIHFVEDIIETESGDFVAVGYTSGDLGNSMKGQGFMLKMSEEVQASGKKEGKIDWIKRFGSNACVFDTLVDVLEADDNKLIAVGKFEKACPKYACHHGYACGDMYFLKIDPADGTTLIEKKHRNFTDQWWAGGNSVIKMDDGYAVGGKIRSNKNTVTNSAVWKLNNNGQMVWKWEGTARKQGNSHIQEYVRAITLSHDSNSILAVGYTRFYKNVRNQKSNMMVWSMDLNGNAKWGKKYADIGGTAQRITRYKNNHYLLLKGKKFFEMDSNGVLIE